MNMEPGFVEHSSSKEKHEQEQEEDKEKGEECRPWSNLVSSLLRSILDLSLVGDDRVSFGCVCKSWHTVVFDTKYYLPSAMIDADPPKTSPPCLLMAGLKKNNIFHPLNHQRYNLNIPELLYYYHNSLAVIRASNFGWLLMMTSSSQVFFFNPFNKIKIRLPDLPPPCFIASISFSSPPTSPDCTVFAFAILHSDIEVVHTIRRGENKWKLQHYNNIRDTESFCNPVVYKENYYYMDNCGNLFLYDTKKRKGRWSIMEKPFKSYITSQKFLVKSKIIVNNKEKEELLSVFLASDGSKIRVYRLNAYGFRMAWENTKDDYLSNKILYLNHTGCFCETVSSDNDGGSTGNKIFLPRFCDHGGCLFYSLTTRKYHSVTGCSHTNFLESKKYSLAKAPPSRAHVNCAWIKPPHSS